jgi:hypothetical protein
MGETLRLRHAVEEQRFENAQSRILSSEKIRDVLTGGDMLARKRIIAQMDSYRTKREREDPFRNWVIDTTSYMPHPVPLRYEIDGQEIVEEKVRFVRPDLRGESEYLQHNGKTVELHEDLYEAGVPLVTDVYRAGEGTEYVSVPVVNSNGHMVDAVVVLRKKTPEQKAEGPLGLRDSR